MWETKRHLYTALCLLAIFVCPTLGRIQARQAHLDETEKFPVKRSFLIDYKHMYIPLGSSPIVDYQVPGTNESNWYSKSCRIIQGRLRAYLRTINRMDRKDPPPLHEQFFQSMNTHRGTLAVVRVKPDGPTEMFQLGKLKKIKVQIAPAGFTKDIPNTQLVHKVDLGQMTDAKFAEHIYMMLPNKTLCKMSVLPPGPTKPQTIDVSAYPSIIDWFVLKGEVYLLEPHAVRKFSVEGSSIKPLENFSNLKGTYKQFLA